jgi:hypothetical protein
MNLIETIGNNGFAEPVVILLHLSPGGWIAFNPISQAYSKLNWHNQNLVCSSRLPVLCLRDDKVLSLFAASSDFDDLGLDKIEEFGVPSHQLRDVFFATTGAVAYSTSFGDQVRLAYNGKELITDLESYVNIFEESSGCAYASIQNQVLDIVSFPDGLKICSIGLPTRIACVYAVYQASNLGYYIHAESKEEFDSQRSLVMFYSLHDQEWSNLGEALDVDVLPVFCDLTLVWWELEQTGGISLLVSQHGQRTRTLLTVRDGAIDPSPRSPFVSSGGRFVATAYYSRNLMTFVVVVLDLQRNGFMTFRVPDEIIVRETALLTPQREEASVT